MANIACRGLQLPHLEKQSWSSPQNGFYAGLMTAVGCSVSTQAVDLHGQNVAPLAKATSLSAWGNLWGLRDLFTRGGHGFPGSTFQSNKMS